VNTFEDDDIRTIADESCGSSSCTLFVGADAA